MKISFKIELNIMVFAFLLNFVWEVLQFPLFQLPTEVSNAQMIWGCTRATIGDVFIILIAYETIALLFKKHTWLYNASTSQIAGCITVGLMITILIEALSTAVLNRWQYREFMPVLPLLGIGLLPFLQWLLLPPWVLWLVKRQLTSSTDSHDYRQFDLNHEEKTE